MPQSYRGRFGVFFVFYNLNFFISLPSFQDIATEHIRNSNHNTNFIIRSPNRFITTTSCFKFSLTFSRGQVVHLGRPLLRQLPCPSCFLIASNHRKNFSLDTNEGATTNISYRRCVNSGYRKSPDIRASILKSLSEFVNSLSRHPVVETVEF